MKRKLSALLSFLFSIFILLLLIFYVKPLKIAQDFSRIPFLYYMPLLFITLIVFLLQTYRFILYLRVQEKKKKILFSKACLAYFVGLFLAVIIPFRAIGELTKSWIFTREVKIKFTKTFAAVTVERIYDLFLFIFFGLLFILFVNVGSAIIWQFFIFLFLFFIALIFLISLFKIKKFRKFVISFISRFSKGISYKVEEYLVNFKKINKSGKIFFLSLSITLVMWFLDAFRVSLIFYFFDVKVNIFLSLSILSLAYIISSISFLPGGLGSFELVFFLLYKILGYGDIAFTVVLIERIFTYWLFIILGAVLYFIFEFKKINWKKIFKKLK